MSKCRGDWPTCSNDQVQGERERDPSLPRRSPSRADGQATSGAGGRAGVWSSDCGERWSEGSESKKQIGEWNKKISLSPSPSHMSQPDTVNARSTSKNSNRQRRWRTRAGAWACSITYGFVRQERKRGGRMYNDSGSDQNWRTSFLLLLSFQDIKDRK